MEQGLHRDVVKLIAGWLIHERTQARLPAKNGHGDAVGPAEARGCGGGGPW
jgi:hypothetical protein